mmetsp:Transcript_156390/g.299916  ORF Transcript_156390/g.299916 Transcript_156390/m.299916 type:complete len:266 (-) Transcript_156390:125-922(-)
MEASQITGHWHLATFTGGHLHVEADENVLVVTLGKKPPLRLYRQHTADGFWASQDGKMRIKRKGQQLCMQLRKGGAWGAEHLACRTTGGAIISFGSGLARSASKTFVSDSSPGAKAKPRKKPGLLCCISGSAARADESEPADSSSASRPDSDGGRPRFADAEWGPYHGQSVAQNGEVCTREVRAQEVNVEESFGDEFALPTRIDRTDYVERRLPQIVPAVAIRKPLLNGDADPPPSLSYRRFYVPFVFGFGFLILIFLGWLYRNY